MARRLSNWLRSYAEFTRNSEAPDIFNFWVGVSTVAGALQRHVFIDQVKFKWYPNFYVILVSPPGIVTKSSTINVGMSLLRNVNGIFMGPQSMTWQGLTYALQNSTQMITYEPVNAADPQNLLSAKFYAQSAITCDVSELGTFLDPRDDQLTSVLIDLWDGKDAAWERWLRSNDNTKIENPWINIVAATTPSWLRANFPENMIGGGLASRVIFVYAEEKKMLVPYINRLVKADKHAALEEALIHDLQEMSDLRGEFVLTEEAYEFGAEWYEQHWNNPDQHLIGDRFLGYRARKQTHIHKLALILSAVEGDSKIIEKRHLEHALNFITGVEYDMHKVFESVSSSESSRHVYQLMNNLKTFGKLQKQDLWRLCMRSMGPKEFGDAIDASVAAGYVKIVNINGVPIFEYLGGEDIQSQALKGAR